MFAFYIFQEYNLIDEEIHRIIDGTQQPVFRIKGSTHIPMGESIKVLLFKHLQLFGSIEQKLVFSVSQLLMYLLLYFDIFLKLAFACCLFQLWAGGKPSDAYEWDVEIGPNAGFKLNYFLDECN